MNPQPADDPVIRITVNGKPAYTVAQAAAHLGMPASGLRRDLAREAAAPTPVAPLDARTPLYDAADIDAFGEFLGQRVGKGSPGVPRPHKAGTPAKSARHK